MAANIDCDVVIIGAGLAGLTAGFLLKDRRILILEAADQPGGRVLTRSRSGVQYDLGAVFGYPQGLVPFAVDASPLMEAAGPIGIFWGDRTHFGRRVSECLKAVGLSEADMDAVRDFHRDPCRDAARLPAHLHTILNAFFQVIHPGEIQDYLPERQRDAFVTHDTRPHEMGNQELIAAYTERLRGKIMCRTQVVSVKEEDHGVTIRFDEKGVQKAIRSRTALLTPPAPSVLNILEHMNDATRSFLKSLRYKEGTVVALGVRNEGMADFSYIVTPGLPMNTVIQQKTSRPGVRLLLIYFAGRKSAALRGRSASEVIELSLGALHKMGIAADLNQHLLFQDLHFWPAVGPVISPQCRKAWNPCVNRPSERVFLAGEYVCWDPHDPLPYGMGPAVISGKEAAAKIEQFFRAEPFRTRFLMNDYRYLMTDKAPLFRGVVEEGNVAYYGLILQAEYDEDLKDYLLDCRRDALWEWQKGYGVTAEDSALVIEGLLESGVDREMLLPSLERLRERFFDPGHGAFRTIVQGRAPYWQGPSIDATAQAGYLMHRMAPERFQDEIGACVRFLLNAQDRRGYWQGKWFPSRLVTTRYAVRLCKEYQPTRAEALQRAASFVLKTQKANGSWNDSVIDTANGILILDLLGLNRDRQREAEHWLRQWKQGPGWGGEAVLYYWFDTWGEAKIFHQSMDKGAIARAWALLALKVLEGKGVGDRERPEKDIVLAYKA